MNRLKVENDMLIFINQELGRINEGLQSEIGQIKSQSSQPSRQPSRSFISDDVDASDNDRLKKIRKIKKKNHRNYRVNNRDHLYRTMAITIVQKKTEK